MNHAGHEPRMGKCFATTHGKWPSLVTCNVVMAIGTESVRGTEIANTAHYSGEIRCDGVRQLAANMSPHRSVCSNSHFEQLSLQLSNSWPPSCERSRECNTSVTILTSGLVGEFSGQWIGRI